MRSDEELYGLYTDTDLRDKRLKKVGRVVRLFHNMNPKLILERSLTGKRPGRKPRNK